MKKMNFKSITILFSALLIGIWSCSSPKTEEKEEMKKEIKFKVKVQEVPVGDQTAKVFHLENGNGMEVELSSFGAVVSKLIVPDRDGKSENIVLGYESIDGYDTNDYYLGATAGRYANRIAKGKFEIDGSSYQVTTNDGNNHLHGGNFGFNRKNWDAEFIEGEESMKVKMTYTSPDGEEGFPGELVSTVIYELTADNKLLISFEATTDKPTIVNLTHHGYFNLSAMKEDILGHELKINAAKYTPVDNELIPTGELKDVSGTPFDFNTPTTIGARISEIQGGYDHNYVVKEQHDGQLTKMAELYHAGSGRVMELYADSPAVQFYSGNFLDGGLTTNGVTYSQYMGLCLEPQTFPNAPNEPSFPSARLNPGEKYSHKIELHFGVR
ncbi:galactose mutarotase-like enzyme [Belliella baltica DSM 15883]|uniref:Aldose 1-epimerase n=1 Tax=Belliella baltica (strain DSM 15883 / CIP 108006 / LMG 21964 / BA134) TaxID=866536 RepID=I3Z543_BELBD|nr:aldose epimerase family protein [Belliella baltica]AFL84361.1 galactose mutarotase-like enzyme [Belliella baltica DSM 15883]